MGGLDLCQRIHKRIHKRITRMETVVSVDILLDFPTDLFLRVKSPQNSISRSLLLSVRLRKGMTHDGGVDAE